MLNYDKQSIAALESRFRAALMNSLSGFKSANLIGTTNGDGINNLAIMSSAFHLGSHPPLLGLIVRPDSAERHTLRNIRASGVYSVNHVGLDMVEQAHQTAARYPADVSEFEATGLTPLWIEGFAAPLVADSSIRLGLELREEHTLEINGTHLVIGEVIHIDVPEAVVDADGAVDIGAAGTAALSGLDAYYEPRLHRRMEYAKPELPPRSRDGFQSAVKSVAR